MARVTGVLLGGRKAEAHEILRSEWDYILYQTDFGLVLSTLCGSVALYDICILLTDGETSRSMKAKFFSKTSSNGCAKTNSPQSAS
jgi:hypothetical protein